MGKILVTDDAAFMRMMLKGIFSELGHQVIEAENGRDMLAKYEEHKPDLVTLDITMPEMDGLTAVKELMAKHKEAVVVMCSAMGQQSMVIDALQAGAKDFIVKPFQPERVKSTAAKFLK